MGSAFVRINGVCKGINRFGKSSVPLHRNFKTHFVFSVFGGKGNNGFVLFAFREIEVADKINNSAVVMIVGVELLAFFVDMAGAIIGQGDC